MRFRQQVHEIEVEAPGKVLDASDIDALVDRFEAKYEQIYGAGTALRSSGVEFTVLRTEATVPVKRPRPTPVAAKSASAQPISVRKVYFYGVGLRETQVYRYEHLGPGATIQGPAIVERPDTTVVVGVGQRLEVEPFGNMILTLNPGRKH
jgi:N-methylhydantoinase A